MGCGGYRNWYENVCPINLTMRLLCDDQLYFHNLYIYIRLLFLFVFLLLFLVLLCCGLWLWSLPLLLSLTFPRFVTHTQSLIPSTEAMFVFDCPSAWERSMEKQMVPSRPHVGVIGIPFSKGQVDLKETVCDLARVHLPWLVVVVVM